ncbi:MAG: hypothetical protein R6V59_06320 [Dehalococcoidia bacterium]
MNGDKRYHAEVKVTLEGREARINVFADTLNEVFKDIGTICTQFPQDWMNPAKREIINAERKAASLRQPQSKPPAPPADTTGEIPVCDVCGTDEFMQIIQFTDKKTGRPRREWKCQQCNQWHWPNGKKR